MQFKNLELFLIAILIMEIDRSLLIVKAKYVIFLVSLGFFLLIICRNIYNDV